MAVSYLEKELTQPTPASKLLPAQKELVAAVTGGEYRPPPSLLPNAPHTIHWNTDPEIVDDTMLIFHKSGEVELYPPGRSIGLKSGIELTHHEVTFVPSHAPEYVLFVAPTPEQPSVSIQNGIIKPLETTISQAA